MRHASLVDQLQKHHTFLVEPQLRRPGAAQRFHPTLRVDAHANEAKRVEQLLPLLAARETSLDAGTADLPPAVERLSSNDTSPEDDAGAKESRDRAKQAVAVALKALSDRERLIVRERMMSDEPATLKALGEVLGVSKERVRQLEERARGKLRMELEALREDALALGVA